MNTYRLMLNFNNINRTYIVDIKYSKEMTLNLVRHNKIPLRVINELIKLSIF